MTKVIIQTIDEESLREDISMSNLLRKCEELKEVKCSEKLDCRFSGKKQICYADNYRLCNIMEEFF
jgi:hypothetical protein